MALYKLIWKNKTELAQGSTVVDAFFKAGHTVNDFITLLDWQIVDSYSTSTNKSNPNNVDNPKESNLNGSN